MLRPKVVAVVGASRRRGTIGAEIFGNLLRSGFTGTVYPVNPGAVAVQGVRAWPSIESLPETVDLVVVAVPSLGVEAVIEAAAAAGAGAAVIISAGFGEAGPAGRARQDRIVEVARAAGMRLCGPNCLGVINAHPDIGLNSTFAPLVPTHGHLGFLSQSGALGVAILAHGAELGLGISTFVSVGNKADVSANDLLEFWETDEDTHAVLLYLESFGNPRNFNRIARRVSRQKPIVAVKSGRSDAGRIAASSHTGSLSGVDIAADALFWQTGVIRVDTLEELFDTAMLLAHQPVPRGRRVGILTNAGGPGILAADACASQGLELPAFSAGLQAGLRQFLPDEAAVRNPVDMIASATPDAFERSVRLVLDSGEVDSLIAIFVPPVITDPQDVADAIHRGAVGADQPVVCNFLGAKGIQGTLPSYAFPESAAIALGRVARYGEWLDRPLGSEPVFDDVDVVRARRALEGQAGWLGPDGVAEILASYGLRSPRSILAATADAAAAAAREIGFPVAVKLVSETLTHKSDIGGVRLGLRTEEDVWDAFSGIRARVDALDGDATMDGVLVQQMVSGGHEVIVGASIDPAFGPVVMFGLGGVNVELLRDVSVRVHPLRDVDADEMLREIRGAPLLTGYRGQPAGDIEALRDVLLRVSVLLGDLPEIAELDLNPVKVLPPGQGVVAVDARIRLRDAV
jgi:acetate---CoA ligase (ADP-forming)